MTIKNKILNGLSWLLLAVVAGSLTWYFTTQATIQQAGDIAEYYGITQTVITEQTLALSPTQQTELEKRLHPEYFHGNPHNYLTNSEGVRYPIHFVFYSILAVPIRLLLEAVGGDPLKSLWLLNVWSLMLALATIWWRYVKNWWQRLVILGLTVLSPLMSFLIWPGPDLWYLSLLLVAMFAFLNKERRLSVLLTVLASWHSQPLIVLAGLLAGYDIATSTQWELSRHHQNLTLNLNKIWQYLLIGAIGLLPYAYNLYAFNSPTPWIVIQDGWTQIRGFGLHNASLQKTFEQLFDFNIGQFWYAPALFVISLASLAVAIWKKNWQVLALAVCTMIAAVFYQTNPGWHYGTAGYGPGRHALLYIPLVIMLSFQLFRHKKVIPIVLLTVALLSQMVVLSFNNFLEPDLTRTLHHSVLAKYVLEHYPHLYNPTPEIFVDRTNHDDQTLPTSAIYKNKEGKCVKAWVLYTDQDLLEAECGALTPDQKFLLDNRFLRLSNQPRQVVTTQATFWPYSDACSETFLKTDSKPYECIRTRADIARLTGVTDTQRFTTVPEYPYPGIWKLNPGPPILMTVPAGYIIHHQSLEGTYVEFNQ